MSESSLVDDCEAAVEQADSVTGSDVYLLKDPLLKDDDEPASSESLDAGSDDIEPAEPHIKRHKGCCQTRHGLAITFAVVVAVFVVAAVVVVVVLSVTSLQGSVTWNPDMTPQSLNQVTSTVVAPRRPVTRVYVDESCMVNVEGIMEDGMAVFKVCCQLVAVLLSLTVQTINGFCCFIDGNNCSYSSRIPCAIGRHSSACMCSTFHLHFTTL